MNMTQAEHADRSLAGCLGPKFLYASENQNPLPGILGADCIISSGRSRVRGLHLLLPKIVESPLTRRHLRAVQCLATHGRLSLTHAGVGKPSRVPARGIYGQHNSRQETLLVHSPCGKRSVGGEKWAELELEMSHEPLSQQPLSNEHSSALLQAVRRFRRFRRVLLPKRLFHPSPLSAWRRVARASPRRIAPAMAPMASKLLAAAASGKGGGGATLRASLRNSPHRSARV